MRKLILMFSIALTFSAHANIDDAFVFDRDNLMIKDGQDGCLNTSVWETKKGVCPGINALKSTHDPVADLTLTRDQSQTVAVAPAPIVAPIVNEVLTQITLKTSELFDFDSSKLTPQAEKDLAKIANESKALKMFNLILVEGHTDNIGNYAYNQQLSIRRANSVRDALIKNGIPKNKIETKGYSFDRPVASNKTKEGRAQNRRVEIIISGLK